LLTAAEKDYGMHWRVLNERGRIHYRVWHPRDCLCVDILVGYKGLKQLLRLLKEERALSTNPIEEK
jgi:hypothetical protein